MLQCLNAVAASFKAALANLRGRSQIRMADGVRGGSQNLSATRSGLLSWSIIYRKCGRLKVPSHLELPSGKTHSTSYATADPFSSWTMTPVPKSPTITPAISSGFSITSTTSYSRSSRQHPKHRSLASSPIRIPREECQASKSSRTRRWKLSLHTGHLEFGILFGKRHRDNGAGLHAQN